jgi:hypothetical protein
MIIKKFNEFITNESFFNKNLPDVDLSDFVTSDIIYKEFKEVGYDAFDVSYPDNLTIVVSPKSYAYDGRFDKSFSEQMQKICDNIGADDFSLTHTFQVKFYFDEDKHPELVPN